MPVPAQSGATRRNAVFATALVVAIGSLAALCLPRPAETPPPDVAVEHAAESPRAAALVRASVAASGTDPGLGAALALEAAREQFTPATLTRLQEALREVAPDTSFRAHQETVTDARFAEDGARVVTASRDGTTRIWDKDGGELAVLRTHQASVRRAEFTGGDRNVLTCSADGTARLWTPAGDPVTVFAGHTDGVLTAALSADGGLLLTVSLDGTARVWDIGGGERARIGSAAHPVTAAAWAGGGTRIVTLSLDRIVRLVDAAGAAIADLREQGEAVERFVVSPDGARVLTASDDGVGRIWDLDGRVLATLRGHGAQILSASFAPKGDRVVTASLDSTARLWSTAGGELAVLRGHAGSVWHVEFAPTGQRILTTSSDSTARLWDADGRSLAVLGGAQHPVALAAWAPTGDLVVTASRDHGTARLWDADGNPVASLRGHGRRIVSAVFSPSGDRLLTISSDLTVRSWITRGDTLLREADARLSREPAGSERLRLGGVSDEPGAAFDLTDADDPASAAIEGPARGDFADPSVCAACHRDQYDRWSASAHARTFEPASADNLPADIVAGGTVEHPPGTTTFRREAGRFLAETVGEDGALHEYHLSHVVGRQRIRMFVATLGDGRMQVLPGMLEEPTGRWFDYTHLLFGGPRSEFESPPLVAPGDASFWTGAVRSWTDRCASCHSSGHEPRHPGIDGGDPRSGWRSLGVDCDACHGPGRAHAEAWSRFETRAPLPKLQELSLRDATSDCTSCHMEADVVAPGFRVGADLFEYRDPTLLLDPERVDAAGRPLELIYDGLPLATSRCAGAGKLTCVRCHDPHGGPNRSQLRLAAGDRALCSGCHAEEARDVAAHSRHLASGEGASCVGCHMPFLTIERGHGAVADHTIGIPYPELESDAVSRDACTWCHSGGQNAPHGVVRIDAEDLRSAYRALWPKARGPLPWMRAIAAARLGRDDAGAGLVETLADTGNPPVVRASAARLLERYGDEHRDDILRYTDDRDSLVRRSAIAALASLDGDDIDARLLEALSDPSKAVRDAAARTALAGWRRVQRNAALLARVIPVLAADARAVPDDHLRWFRLGAARDIAGDVEGAIDAYEHQLALDPFAHAVRRKVERLRK